MKAVSPNSIVKTIPGKNVDDYLNDKVSVANSTREAKSDVNRGPTQSAPMIGSPSSAQKTKLKLNVKNGRIQMNPTPD